MSIRYVQRELFIDDARHEVMYPISDAIEYQDPVIILFDPDGADEGDGRFHNLVALRRGKIPSPRAH